MVDYIYDPLRGGLMTCCSPGGCGLTRPLHKLPGVQMRPDDHDAEERQQHKRHQPETSEVHVAQDGAQSLEQAKGHTGVNGAVLTHCAVTQLNIRSKLVCFPSGLILNACN